ncbi:hypothetical protein KBD68_04400 [Candidatus Woesebacteria bacterium]|nr:hypothetical protein [Candidatus Woesebacteria bacterium]
MEPNTTIPPVQKQEPVAQKPLENTAAGAATHSHESVGPIVGSLIIVILLIVAALYIWAQKVSDDVATSEAPAAVVVEEKLTPEQTTAVQETGLDIEVEELEDLNF